MSTNMPVGNLNIESQLMSVMNVLVKTAVVEIIQMFSENTKTLRLHLSQSLKENETLRIRMKLMRSELFSLRLQNKTNRPPSRFTSFKTLLPKSRAKPQVINKSPDKPDVKTSPVSVETDIQASSSAGPSQHRNDETPDIILIKDEDDAGGCGTIVVPDNLDNKDVQSSVMTGTQKVEPAVYSCVKDINQDLRIVSVHCGVEGAMQVNSEALFSISEVQALSSRSDHNTDIDSLPNFSASDRASMMVMQDNNNEDAGSSLHERNHSTQMSLAILNPTLNSAVVGANDPVGHPGLISQLSLQQTVFPPSVSKLLDCSFCNQSFLSREDLIVHRATHTGESPVTCSFCNKSFVTKTTLSIHMRIHTGEKPYVCPECGKCFTQNGSLKIHRRTHSGEKPYSCNQCTASFNNPSNLRRHMITHSS